ncbi:unnamed protein product [Litomosoides sigmodontis]|uniref:Uncharacterized protein n=1 Tax=Litomosoides sigmodontis TaxID=42156 RepID=A0A3P6TR42_LITSI|nr:unnamed protein product [Litomosoides sigmodontis]
MMLRVVAPCCNFWLSVTITVIVIIVILATMMMIAMMMIAMMMIAIMMIAIMVIIAMMQWELQAAALRPRAEVAMQQKRRPKS